MALLTITPAEIKRRKIIKPGWYHFKITEYALDRSKSDNTAFNHVFDGTGLEGDAKEVPIKVFFPEKYPDMAIGIVEAFLGKKLSEETGLTDFDMANIKGAILRAHVNPQKDKNQVMRNNIDEWAPKDSAFTAGSENF
jgi:hypothetical protein